MQEGVVTAQKKGKSTTGLRPVYVPDNSWHGFRRLPQGGIPTEGSSAAEVSSPAKVEIAFSGLDERTGFGHSNEPSQSGGEGNTPLLTAHGHSLGEVNINLDFRTHQVAPPVVVVPEDPEEKIVTKDLEGNFQAADPIATLYHADDFPVEEGVPEELSSEIVTESLAEFSPCICGSGNCQGCRGVTLEAGALLWWIEGFGTPVLATTSPEETPQADAGVLGQPDTSVLFGGEEVNDHLRSGGRIRLTKYVGPCYSLEAGYTFLEQQSRDFFTSSAEVPIVGRPYFDVVGGEEVSGLTAFPGLVGGSLAVHAETELGFANLAVRRALRRDPCKKVDLMVGYRYGRLKESLGFVEINEATQIVIEGTALELIDQFNTLNEFHGGEIGLVTELERDCWKLELMTKLCLGNTRSSVTVRGETIQNVPGEEPTTFQGGFLAQGTNIGDYEENSFSVIPEFNITLTRQLWCGWKAMLGYTFLFWTDVARPGDQIDRELNDSQFPPGELVGESRPAFQHTSSDMWVQGISLGFQRLW
ncbi:MAG: hypothetical protein CMJ81_09820 [Planctomycetaceae bacterium]|nr:hypothetical protein [Planctomycetaceae bacterium]MBP63747.1 hypothetical protein [Planctomycetaceae bacterium]